jgi:hypothetical protein
VICKSINKAIAGYKTVIFLKEKDLGGMEFGHNDLANWHLYAILPCFLIMFAQPKLVPKVISYKGYIGGSIALFLFFIFLIPILVDVYNGIDPSNTSSLSVIEFFMKFNYMLMNVFTVKLFTPAINILLNYYLDKYMRTALNSIFYLGVSFVTLALNPITMEVMNYFFNNLIEPETKWVKY